MIFLKKISFFLLTFIQVIIFSGENKNNKQSIFSDLFPAEIGNIISDYTISWKLIKEVDFQDIFNQEDRRAFGTKGFIALDTVAINPDKTKLALIETMEPDQITIYDIESEKSTIIIDKLEPSSRSLNFSPNGENLAISTSSLITTIFNFNANAILKTIPIGGQVIYSQDGKYLAGLSKKNVLLFDTDTYNIIHKFEDANYIRFGKTLTFSPDNNLFAYITIPQKTTNSLRQISRNNGIGMPKNPEDIYEVKYYINIWDIRTKQLINQFAEKATHNPPHVMTFSCDSKYLAIGDNYNINLWDISNSIKVKTIKYVYGVTDLDFSPNNKFLAAGGESLKIFDIKGNLLFEKMAKRVPPGNLEFIKFSQNSKLLYLLNLNKLQIRQYQRIE